MKTSYYQTRKEAVRQEAIDWQHDFANHDWDWNELLEKTEYFTRLGKRYGLLREFHENAIC